MKYSETEEWQLFWKEYRKKTVENEFDLYFQVGRTSDKQPMPEGTLNQIVEDVKLYLQLNKNERLLELCCGNGLITFELKDLVKEIVAIDFTDHLIASAKKFKNHQNIDYLVSNALNPIKMFSENPVFDKYLMCDSLAYFKPTDIRTLLMNIMEANKNPFLLLFASVPDENLKWEFYNNAYRMEWYNTMVEIHETTYDPSCIGRWWRKEELIQLVNELNLNCNIFPSKLYSYRFEVVISR